MEVSILFKQIESLPESVRAQLADYVAFLVEKYSGSAEDAEPDWAVIDAEVDAIEANRDLAIPEETVNQSLRARHADSQNPI